MTQANTIPRPAPQPAPVIECICGRMVRSRQAAYVHMVEAHPLPAMLCPGCGLNLSLWRLVYPDCQHQCRVMAEDARQQQSHEAGAAMDGFEGAAVAA